MKALSKPLSSPGRAEKFPTPLMMRFLRTNVGSRSRGRSRSSPMFILRSKKNGNAAAINETQQEPSSPKVTCIGQVRVRRSSKNSSSASSKSKKKGRSACSPRQPQCPCYHSSCSCSFTCCGVPRTRFCHGFFSRFHKPKSFGNPFRKWVTFFHFGYCKKVNTRDDSSRFGSIHRSQNHVTAVNSASDIGDSERDVKEAQLVREIKDDFLKSSSPPKNALLLTRCRSAPYRSSSLAVRFWGSPLRSPERETPKNEPEEPAEEGGMGRPVSPNVVNEEAEPRNSGSHEENEELDSSSSNGRSKDSNVQDLGTTNGRESIYPLLLTRCKSEPARTGERLNPEANSFTQRRSDTAESCLQLPKINCD